MSAALGNEIGWWCPSNDETQDGSGNGYHPSFTSSSMIINPSVIAGTPNEGGLAYSLDGTDDRVTGPNSLGVASFDNSTWSLALWFKADNFAGSSGTAYLFSYGEAFQSNNWWLRTTGTGSTIEWTESGNSLSYSPPGGLNTDQWYHIAITINESGNMKMYLDGSEVDSDSYGFPPMTFITPIPTAGGDASISGSNASHWDGHIDDIRVYAVELSSANVTSISGSRYTPATISSPVAGVSGIESARFAPYDTQAAGETFDGLNRALASSHDLDEYDSALGTDMTIVSDTDDGGVLAIASLSTSKSHQSSTLVNQETLVDFGISLWIKLDSLPSSGQEYYLASINDNGGTNTAVIKVQDDGQVTANYKTRALASTTNLSTDVWYFVAFNGTSSGYNLRVGASTEDSAATTSAFTPFRITLGSDGSGSDRPPNGSYDDVRFFLDQDASSAINTHYNSGSRLGAAGSNYTIFLDDADAPAHVSQADVEISPLYTNNVDSPSEAEQSDVIVLYGMAPSSLDSQAECESPGVTTDIDYEAGFETGLDGWTETGGKWYWQDPDSIYTSSVPAKGKGSAVVRFNSSGVNADRELSNSAIRVQTDTTALGLTELSFWTHFKLGLTYSDFPYYGGFQLLVNGEVVMEKYSWWSGSDVILDDWERHSYIMEGGDNTIVFRVVTDTRFPSDFMLGLDSVHIRNNVSAPVEVNGAQSGSLAQGFNIGLLNQQLAVDDSDAQAEVSSTNIPITLNPQDSDAQSECEGFDVSAGFATDIASVESQTECEQVIITGLSVLQVDDVDCVAECMALSIDINPNDVDAASEVSVPDAIRPLTVNMQLAVNSAESASECESVAATGFTTVPVNSADAGSEVSTPAMSLIVGLAVNSAESTSEALGFAVGQTVVPTDVSLCSTDDDNEDIESAVAGEDIFKGAVVRIDNDGRVVLANASSQSSSLLTGIALNTASAGEPVIVATSGTVVLGTDALRPLQIYALSTRPGYMRHVTETGTGDYISLVGLATAADRITLGFDFQSRLLTVATEESTSTTHVDPVPASVEIEGTEAASAGNASALQDIEIGDVLNRSQALASSNTATDSSFLGVAVTDADSGCSIAYVGNGVEVNLGANVLVKNNVYVIGRQPGKMLRSVDVIEGEYLTIAGLAVSESTIRLGGVARGTLAT